MKKSDLIALLRRQRGVRDITEAPHLDGFYVYFYYNYAFDKKELIVFFKENDIDKWTIDGTNEKYLWKVRIFCAN